ncbi:MAG: response regulator [Elusimicrobia bacterium]|nr:response regulator [Elusimicrobiota bacterium]MBU2613939.1 response regulator [Elusimicrobiota bacterium]
MKTIFIIEDDPDVSLLIKDVFEANKVIATFFSSSALALKEIKKQRPDIIIMDLMMPNISGFEVCQYIRADLKLKDILIMVITGYDSPKMRKEIFSYGIDDYLPKPFDYRIFMEKVNRLLK